MIVKSTKCYTDGGYKDYDEVALFQMIGRAGRSQFDSSATALILTSMQDKVSFFKNYEKQTFNFYLKVFIIDINVGIIETFNVRQFRSSIYYSKGPSRPSAEVN